MQEILSAQQMSEVDRLSTSEFGIPSIELMENAATAVFETILEEFEGRFDGINCLILCGKGNNGGDGAAVARLLAEAGAEVFVFLVGKIESTAGDARINFERLKEDTICEIGDETGIEQIWEKAADLKPELIVDALFGTGLDRPVEGIHKTVVAGVMDYAATANPTPVLLSIDIPTGLDADKAEPIGLYLKPDITVTFTSPKLANVLPPACRFQGRLVVKDIGSSKALVDRADSKTFVFEASDVKSWLESTRFSDDSFKKRRGSVLIAAGSRRYTGAAVLAANAAMRSGAGIVNVVVPESSYDAIASRVLPEVMVRPVPETADGAFSTDSFLAFEEISSDAVLVGCGITSDESETSEFVRQIVEHRSTPIVIDADGLNCLSPFEINGSDEFPVILTPHEGEFRRLSGNKEPIYPDERIDLVRAFAAKHQLACVLKGERTLVAAPDGRVVVIPVGNPGLGKAGNGDNLAGIIAGFAAQQVQIGGCGGIFEATASAVFVAGLAGDIAEAKFGKHVMTASDVRECLSKAFETVLG